MTLLTVDIEQVGVVSVEWMVDFFMEVVEARFMKDDGSIFAINSDGMWYFENKHDSTYDMYKVLKE
jgi:hypothetical protein